MGSNKNRFTKEQDQAILAKSADDSELARRFNRSVNSIQNRRHVLLKNGHQPPTETDAGANGSTGKTTRVKRTVLSFTERRKLAGWLEDNDGRLLAGRYTVARAAHEARAALDMKKLRSSHVHGLVSELDTKWKGVGRGGARSNPPTSAVQGQRLLRLSRIVAKFLRELNEEVPLQLIRDCEVTVEELDSMTLDQLVEAVGDADYDEDNQPGN